MCVTGQKYECARKWNIHCVSLHWLFDSIEKGFCQDETRYTVMPGAAKPSRLHASTPTRGSRKDGEPSSSDVTDDDGEHHTCLIGALVHDTRLGCC